MRPERAGENPNSSDSRTGDFRLPLPVLSGAQWEVLQRAAALAGVDVETYVRSAVLDRVKRDLPTPAVPLPDASDGVLRVDEAIDTGAAVVEAAAVGAPSPDGRRVWSWWWDRAPGDGTGDASGVSAPAQARVLVHAVLSGLGLAEAADLSVVLVSELVTNAIRHGAAPIGVRLVVDHADGDGDGQVTCGVSDAAAAAPSLRRAGLEDEDGRGLALMVRLSADCGWFRSPVGKTVWFAQPLPRAGAGRHDTGRADGIAPPPESSFHLGGIPDALR
ncbi:ATP-binding protein [Spirillospora sp. NPDC000708]